MSSFEENAADCRIASRNNRQQIMELPMFLETLRILDKVLSEDIMQVRIFILLSVEDNT